MRGPDQRTVKIERHLIVDFACRDRKLIVEVDGGQHSENAKDRVRDEALRAAGYKVLRFWNSDVLKNKESCEG